MLRGTAQTLPRHGPLFLYGPFRRQDRPLEPSNQAFDDDLRSRNMDWGLRYLEDVVQLAVEFGFSLDKDIEMPANNLSVLFRRT